jgi:IclR family pca regulon transcriptional regulator
MSVGTRFPAYATSMGRVLRAGLRDDQVDRMLAEADLRRLTSRTIRSPQALREEIDRGAARPTRASTMSWRSGLRSIAAPIRD